MVKIFFDDYHFKLVILTTLVLFVFKFYRTLNYQAIVYNSLVKFSILFIFLVLYKLITQNKSQITKIIVSVIYYIIFVINFFLFMLTNYFFNDTSAIKYSFFSVNFHYFSFFTQSILQPSLIISIIILVGFLFLLPLVNISKIISLIDIKKGINIKQKSFNSNILLYLSVIGILIVPLTLSVSMNNVYATTVIDISQLPFQSFVLVSQDFNEVELQYISRDFEEYSQYQIERDRVLVFIMEQVSYSDFLEDYSSIPQEENFFKRVEENMHHYSNYFTQNQDSLGGLWSLLYGAFIPFESYIDNWNEEFGYVMGEDNMVDLFNYHEYHTVTAAAQLESSLILGAFEWDENIFLPKFPFEGKVCIRELEYQSGCEDIVIIEEVKDSIRNNEQTFLFQEFIFGHGESYIIQSGMSRVEYYNMYMNLMYDFLEEEKLVENTTIIVVADHGDKGFMSKEIHNYRIPFMVIDLELEYQNIDTMYSHIDFKDILFSYLDSSRELPPQRDQVHIIGQTASSEIAYINSNQSYFTAQRFIGNLYTYESPTMNRDEVGREIQQILLHQKNSRNLSSQENFYCFHCYLNNLDIIRRRE
ncbi:MAG: hypothetical protein ACMXYB_05340 [Candidatus Woesearchaeota archaeon]